MAACSLDVKVAFLNASIKENMWFKPPKELNFLLEILLLRIKDHKQTYMMHKIAYLRIGER